jgi:hypothetical protein
MENLKRLGDDENEEIVPLLDKKSGEISEGSTSSKIVKEVYTLYGYRY